MHQSSNTVWGILFGVMWSKSVSVHSESDSALRRFHNSFNWYASHYLRNAFMSARLLLGKCRRHVLLWKKLVRNGDREIKCLSIHVQQTWALDQLLCTYSIWFSRPTIAICSGHNCCNAKSIIIKLSDLVVRFMYKCAIASCDKILRTWAIWKYVSRFFSVSSEISY